MARRSPSRFLAPVALAAVAFALYTIVKPASEPAGKSSSATPAHSSTPAKKTKKSSKTRRHVYVVKSGDTASGIAAKTGVSIETMQKLNKNFDPQTLSPGQRIRLSG